MITTINTGPADGWHLVITARAGLARRALEFAFIRNGPSKKRTGVWLAGGRWDSTRWSPDLGSEARAIAETWLLANPVPAPGAGVKP